MFIRLYEPVQSHLHVSDGLAGIMTSVLAFESRKVEKKSDFEG